MDTCSRDFMRATGNAVHLGFGSDASAHTNPPVPPFFKGGRRGDLFGKGGRGGISPGGITEGD
jgi:hypothetical protein